MIDIPEFLTPLFEYNDFSIELKSTKVMYNKSSVLPYYIDLNTQMKSHCHLVKEADWYAFMRYDKIVPIHTLDDLLREIEGCIQGRKYMNHVWGTILLDNGYSLSGLW